MRVMKSPSLLAAATVLLAIAPAAWARSLPKLKVKDLNGQRVSLKAYEGKAKIIVLNFWATWCGPCQQEMPMLVKEEARYKARGVQVIGVSIDKRRNQGKVRRFIAKHHIDFPIWVGGTGADVGRWKLGPAVPATAFIMDGRIVGRVMGEMHQSGFEHRINWLLGDHQGAPPKAVQNNLNVKE